LNKILIFLFNFSALIGCFNVQTPRIQQGILDLSNKNLDEILLKLDGEWKFYWMQTPEDIQIEKEKNFTFIKFPTSWEKNFFNPQQTKGYATYQLKVKNNLTSNLTLFIPTIWFGYDVYINQKKIFSHGKTSIDIENFIPKINPVYLQLPTNSENFSLEIVIYDPFVGTGRVETSIILSSLYNIKKYNQYLDYEYTFFIGMIFMMAIFYFTFYFLNTENPSFLYFGFVILLIGTRELFSGQKIFIQLLEIPFIFSYKIQFICEFLAVIFFTKFMRYVFPHEIYVKIDQWLLYLSPVVIVYILVSNYLYLYWLGLVFFIGLILLMIYFLFCIFKAYKKNRENSGIYLVGFLIVSLIFFNDILNYFSILNNGYYLIYAYFLFLFLLSCLISKKNSKSYRELRILGNQLRKISKVKDDFMSNLSHEMRTPLSLIYAFSELLVENPKTDPEVIESYSRDIHREAKSLIEIINDLMMVTDLETKFNMRIKKNKIDEMLQEACNYLETFREEKNISIELSGDESTLVKCDRSLMVKLLIIIIKNAIVYNKNNGFIKISWHLEIDKKVHIVITDSGFGIPLKDLPYIFDKFFRVDNSITYKVSGVGVGLFIAKRIVELHGGEIYVESELGQGSRFHILLNP